MFWSAAVSLPFKWESGGGDFQHFAVGQAQIFAPASMMN